MARDKKKRIGNEVYLVREERGAEKAAQDRMRKGVKGGAEIGAAGEL